MFIPYGMQENVACARTLFLLKRIENARQPLDITELREGQEPLEKLSQFKSITTLISHLD